MNYNLYFGTQDGPLKIQYRYTRSYGDENEAKNAAFEGALALYYKNEGKNGLPGYSTIVKESEITGINIIKLYEEHARDLMYYFAVPTDVDTVSVENIKSY